MRWYGSQLYRVRCGDFLSDGFTSTNGVAQGGILSPRFFNVYIVDLSIALSNSKHGYTFGGCSVNHLSYADDMVIISPSATALQKLLDICSVYTEKHDIVYTVKKSVRMVILEYVERYKYLGMIIHLRNYDYNITTQINNSPDQHIAENI